MPDHETYVKRTSQNICAQCPKTATHGTLCHECRKKHTESKREHRQRTNELYNLFGKIKR